MKKLLCFMLVVPVFIVSCATVPRAEFNPSKPIQDIALAKHEAIYAQHDVVLSADSLDQKLRAMSSEFDQKIGRARLYQGFELATFLAEIGALVGCISSTNSANALGWCGGTIAMAGATLLLHQSASDLRQDVVTTYNKKYAPEVQP